MPKIAIAEQPERKRYEIDVDGVQAGFVTYRLESGRISFLHAEVDPSVEGQGLGSRLVKFALDDAGARGLEVLPCCPFVKVYIERHEEYRELVPETSRAHFGL